MTGKEEHMKKSIEKVNRILEVSPDYVSGFYYSMLNSGKTQSYRTREEYVKYIAKFLSSIEKDIQDVTMDDITIYLGKKSVKADGSAASGSYLVAVYSALKKFFTYMVASKRLASNPMDGIDRPAPKKPELIKRTYLTEKEIKKCFNVVEREGGMWKERNTVILILFFCTGIRNTALTEINVENIDFENNCVNVIDKGTKAKRCYLSEDKMEKIREWLEKREELLNGFEPTDALFFGKRRKRISQSGTGDIIEKITTQIGHKISPHKARASFATNALNNGISLYEVSQLLGHSSTQVTSDCYIQGKDDMVKNAGLKAGSFMKF